jgi:GNAT superfamily N-acetyltransferase
MEYIAVCMVRGDLENVPDYPLPEGYSMRRFRPGDRKTWLRVERAAETLGRITGGLFDEEFGDDPAVMARRCCFLVAPNGREVGTITAWFDRKHLGRRWGRIHYVAIVPEHQGKRLSRCIMTVAMRRLRALGHRRAMLVTQTPRIAAIRTYLRFGFVPDWTTPWAERAWKLVGEHISHPALA